MTMTKENSQVKLEFYERYAKFTDLRSDVFTKPCKLYPLDLSDISINPMYLTHSLNQIPNIRLYIYIS